MIHAKERDAYADLVVIAESAVLRMTVVDALDVVSVAHAHHAPAVGADNSTMELVVVLVTAVELDDVAVIAPTTVLAFSTYKNTNRKKYSPTILYNFYQSNII